MYVSHTNKAFTLQHFIFHLTRYMYKTKVRLLGCVLPQFFFFMGGGGGAGGGGYCFSTIVTVCFVMSTKS